MYWKTSHETLEGDYEILLKTINTHKNLSKKSKQLTKNALRQYMDRNSFNRTDTFRVSIEKNNPPEVEWLHKAGEISLQEEVKKALQSVKPVGIRQQMATLREVIASKNWSENEFFTVNHPVNLGGEHFELEVSLSHTSTKVGDHWDKHHSVKIRANKPGKATSWDGNVFDSGDSKDLLQAFDEAWKKFQRSSKRAAIELEPIDQSGDLDIQKALNQIVHSLRELRTQEPETYFELTKEIMLNGKSVDIHVIQRVNNNFSGNTFQTKIGIEQDKKVINGLGVVVISQDALDGLNKAAQQLKKLMQVKLENGALISFSEILLQFEALRKDMGDIAGSTNVLKHSDVIKIVAIVSPLIEKQKSNDKTRKAAEKKLLELNLFPKESHASTLEAILEILRKESSSTDPLVNTLHNESLKAA